MDDCQNNPSVQQALAKLRQIAAAPAVHALLRVFGPETGLAFVGGTVRDALLGHEPADLDFAIALRPEAILARLETAGIRVIPTGLKHQTVTAVLDEPFGNVELTTFRGANMNPKGGIVASGSLSEDLQYRDFTVNAFAVDCANFRFFGAIDGLDDLENKLIRTVGDAKERFREDPLRLLRMIRFACVLDFSIEPQTLQAATVMSAELSQVSLERVRDEFSKILVSPKPADGIRLAQQTGLLKAFLPEVDDFVGFEQNDFHQHDLFDHTLEVVRRTDADLVLRLAALFHDVSKPESLTIDADTGDRHFFRHETMGIEKTRGIMTRLKFPGAMIDAVCVLVGTHMRPLEAGPGGLRRILRDTAEQFPNWRKLKEADAASCLMDEKELRDRLAAFDTNMAEVLKGPPVSPLKSLAINGRDLLKTGMRESREIGEILRALHERVLDNPELNSKEILLGMVEEVRSKIAAQK